MREQAEDLLVQTVRQELEKKSKELNLPSYSLRVTTDTVPLAVFIITAEGRKEYKVNPLKSEKNISQSAKERFLHSVIYEKRGIDTDTLQHSWMKALQAYTIYAQVTISTTVTPLEGEVNTRVSTNQKNLPLLLPNKFVIYLGNRCEVEMVASLEYFWWSVYVYAHSLFLRILLVTFIVMGIFIWLYILKLQLLKRKIVEKTVVVVKEIPHNIYTPVKEVRDAEVESYQLRPGLIFDSHKQILVVEGKKVKLRPQSCVLLKIFLDAPEYTLTDKEILNLIWGDDQAANIKRFTVACSRVRNEFKKVNFSVNFNRVGTDKYRMFWGETDESLRNDPVVVNGSN